MRPPSSWLLLLAALLAAGCLDGPSDRAGSAWPQGVAGPTFSDVRVDLANCVQSCYEPTVAVVGPRILVSLGPTMARSDDGGRTFVQLPGPPQPEPALPVVGDHTLQVDGRGRLWFTGLADQQVDPTAANLFGALAAIQVASSGDGGQTWDRNVLIRPDGNHDRQWLLVDGDTAVVTYLSVDGDELWLRYARSTDGGRTFGPGTDLVRDASLGGQGVALPGGVFLSPHYSFVDGASTRVMRSTDAGQSWEPVTIVRGGDGYFVNLAVGPGGVVHAAFRGSGIVYHATSSDQGATWSTPRQVSLPGETVAASPWPLPGPDGVAITYFTLAGPDEGPATLWLARLSDGSVTRSEVAQVPTLRSQSALEPFTDLAHGALLADGRAVLAWVSQGDTVHAGVEG